MPQLTLDMKSQKDTKQVLSAQDLKDKFLFGVTLQKDGHEFPESLFDFYIQAAKAEIEKYLSVKLSLQIISEDKDYRRDDWMTWSQIRTTYQIVTPISLSGYFGSIKQIDFPQEWLSARKTSDGELFSKLLHVIPKSGAAFQMASAVYTGLYPNNGYMGLGTITPDYWKLKYVTGFKVLPADIEQAIGMLASINILTVGNETLASAMGALGVGSKSISIDGLSQSTSMYVNGQSGIFGARIKQYTESLLGANGLLQRLRDYYGTFIFTTL